MSQKPKVLLFPYLAHGHVFPFLQLARVLSQNNFLTYLCSTPVILNSIKEDLKNKSNDFPIEFVEFHLPELPQLPPHLHTTKNLPPNLMPVLLQALNMSIPQFTQIFDDLQPDLLILDLFQTWSAKIAFSRGTPSAIFYTSSCIFYNLFQHLLKHKDFDSFLSPAIRFHDYEKVKLLKTMAFGSSSTKHSVDGEKLDFKTVLTKYCSDIVLVNSCRSIEGKYMDQMSILMGKKIVSAGPVISKSARTSDYTDILEFMDQKLPCSIVYLSFGSENYLSKQEMEEMAKGLELSNVNFIWVVRMQPGDEDSILLEEGFMERTSSRGMIVKNWAPQTEILAHPNVGAFVSHCGWSSINESIYFGVPIIGFPFRADQPVNCKLLLELGVGIEIRRDDSGKFDGEAVAEAIKEIIMEEKGEELRRRVGEVGKNMKIDKEEAFGEFETEISRICSLKHVD